MADDLLAKFDLENWDNSRIEALLGSPDKEYLSAFPDADLVYYLGRAHSDSKQMGSFFLLFMRLTDEETTSRNLRVGSQYVVYLCDTTAMSD